MTRLTLTLPLPDVAANASTFNVTLNSKTIVVPHGVGVEKVGEVFVGESSSS